MREILSSSLLMPPSFWHMPELSRKVRQSHFQTVIYTSWVGHEIKQNDEATIILIDSMLIACGSKEEYQTLIRLLQYPMECVAFCDLMPFFEYERDRATLGKRIQKLRRKLPPSMTIRCEAGVGYILREKSRRKTHEVLQHDAPGM